MFPFHPAVLCLTENHRGQGVCEPGGRQVQSDQNRERIRYLGLLVGYIDLLYIGCQCLLLPGRQYLSALI